MISACARFSARLSSAGRGRIDYEVVEFRASSKTRQPFVPLNRQTVPPLPSREWRLSSVILQRHEECSIT